MRLLSAVEAVAAIPDLVSAVGKASKLEIQARLANSNALEFQEWVFAAKK